MSEANEDIVRRYLELDGYFMPSQLTYKHAAEDGSGWSDVDLCGFNPVTRNAVALEVKGWHTERIALSHIKEWPSLFYFTRDEATKALIALWAPTTSDASQLTVDGTDQGLTSYHRRRACSEIPHAGRRPRMGLRVCNAARLPSIRAACWAAAAAHCCDERLHRSMASSRAHVWVIALNDREYGG